MRCYVYRCRRRAGAYLYLIERDGFERVPEPLRVQLGGFDFALEFEFGVDRRLASADPAVVRANLVERGFHLQFPPDPMRAAGTDVRD